MAIRKPVDQITQSDLEGLIASEVVEDQTTEYKRDLNITGEQARREFFRDVSSFANAIGGDIVFGIHAADGKPEGLSPLNDLDVDATPLQLRDLCLAHIDPPIRGLTFRVIPFSRKHQKGHVLVVRVPQSWNRPHMVKYDDNRFYRRDGAGKRQMNTSELREAFALSASTGERMKEHRLERLSLIRQRQTPVTLPPSTAFIARCTCFLWHHSNSVCHWI